MLEIHPCSASCFSGSSCWLCFVLLSRQLLSPLRRQMRSSVVCFLSWNSQFGCWEGDDPNASKGIRSCCLRNPKKTVFLSLLSLMSPFSSSFFLCRLPEDFLMSFWPPSVPIASLLTALSVNWFWNKSSTVQLLCWSLSLSLAHKRLLKLIRDNVF